MEKEKSEPGMRMNHGIRKKRIESREKERSMVHQSITISPPLLSNP